MKNKRLCLYITAIMRSQLKKERGKFFLPHWDLNHGPPEPKVSELPEAHLFIKITSPLLNLQCVVFQGLCWLKCSQLLTQTLIRTQRIALNVFF